MQTQWQGAQACLSGGHAVQCAAVVISLTAGCVIVSNLKHFVPLASARIGNDGNDLETPRLPVVLCPHSTMVRGSKAIIAVLISAAASAVGGDPQFYVLWFCRCSSLHTGLEPSLPGGRCKW